MPKRIQFSKDAGVPVPADAVLCCGPGQIWGCPIRPTPKTGAAKCFQVFRKALEMALKGEPIPKQLDGFSLVKKKRSRIRRMADNLHLLRGKDLACYCTPDYPCHVGALLEFANVPLTPPASEAATGPEKKPRKPRKKKTDGTASPQR